MNIPTFKCPLCKKKTPLFDIAYSHGVIFLFGKKYGYYGGVCPECKSTGLRKARNKNVISLKNKISGQVGKLEGSTTKKLQYNSFPYSLNHVEKLSALPSAEYSKPVSGITGNVLAKEVNNLFVKKPELMERYCSYSFNDTAMGPVVNVWWYNEFQIDSAIKYENRKKQRVFPRYIFYDSLIFALQTFFWKYSSNLNSIPDLELCAFPEYELHEHSSDLTNNTIQKNSEFLAILKYMPSNEESSRNSVKTDPPEILRNQENIWREISENFDNLYVKSALSYFSDRFLPEFFTTAQRLDYSANDVYRLKERYMRDILKGISNRIIYSKPSDDISLSLSPMAFCDTLEFDADQLGDEESSLEEKSDPEDEGISGHEEILTKVESLENRLPSFKKIVTQNYDLMELKYKVAEMAKFNTDVLILGETGTGKELFAKAIHQASQREGKFVPVNCSAIPKTLFETELFGHRKGAFSGAFFEKKGAFEYADKGTLFLDEIGEMPLDLQAKILRAVEYRTINRVGCVKPINVNIKIVFATNRDHKREVDEGKFRKDLFFRIFSPSFRIIPLRERIEDLPILIDNFITSFNKKFGKRVESVSPSLMSRFKHYAWEGNVRELMKVIEMGVINSSGSKITEKEIPYFNNPCDFSQDSDKSPKMSPATKITDDEIQFWMKKLNGNKSQVARRLGVSYRTILRRAKKIYK